MIYNHRMDEICDAYALVPGHECWGGVAFGISCPGDVVQMHPSLRGLESAIRAHYSRCGVPVAEDIVWDDAWHHLAGESPGEMSVAMFGESVHRQSPDFRWRSAVERFQDKNEFIAWARGTGAPVPKTVCFSAGCGAVEHGLSYPVFVKDARSLSGLGIERCLDGRGLVEAVRGRMDPFQVQEALPGETMFLNVQYAGTNAGSLYIATTRQILDGWSHRGNTWPEPINVRTVTDSLAEELVRLGMRGVFALDVAVAGWPDRPRVWVLECNPRWNGSSYFWFLAQKLGATAWTGLVASCPTDFHSMDLGGLEFRPATGEGIVLVDWTRVNQGAASVLVVGSPERQRAFLRDLSRGLGWGFPAPSMGADYSSTTDTETLDSVFTSSR